MSAKKIIDGILKREGSAYTNIPGDKGGPTKFGITLAKLSEVRAHVCKAEDVRDLTEEAARLIYEVEYIIEPGFSKIENQYLQELIVDCGVNHGVGRAAKWLQQAVGVKVDGKVGDKTAQAVNSGVAKKVFASVLCTRLRFYEDLDDAPSQAKFDMGWTNRCCEFVMLLAEM